MELEKDYSEYESIVKIRNYFVMIYFYYDFLQKWHLEINFKIVAANIFSHSY